MKISVARRMACAGLMITSWGNFYAAEKTAGQPVTLKVVRPMVIKAKLTYPKSIAELRSGSTYNLGKTEKIIIDLPTRGIKGMEIKVPTGANTIKLQSRRNVVDVFATQNGKESKMYEIDVLAKKLKEVGKPSVEGKEPEKKPSEANTLELAAKVAVSIDSMQYFLTVLTTSKNAVREEDIKKVEDFIEKLESGIQGCFDEVKKTLTKGYTEARPRLKAISDALNEFVTFSGDALMNFNNDVSVSKDFKEQVLAQTLGNLADEYEKAGPAGSIDLQKLIKFINTLSASDAVKEGSAVVELANLLKDFIDKGSSEDLIKFIDKYKPAVSTGKGKEKEEPGEGEE